MKTKHTIEQAIALAKAQQCSKSSRVDKVQIIAEYSDGAALIGYVHSYPGLGKKPCYNRRVFFITSEGAVKWDMIAD